MKDPAKGIRALPPALTLAFAVWIGVTVVRLAYLLAATEPWRAVRFNLVTEGTSIAAEVLALVGALELARNLTGVQARGTRVAALGFGAILAVDVAYGGVNLLSAPWQHEWIYQVTEYAFFSAWLLVPIGLALALWSTHRALAIIVFVVCLVTWPPPFFAKTFYGWLPDGKAGWTIDIVLRCARFTVLIAAFAQLGRPGAHEDRSLAAAGLRTAAKGLWLRVIAAIAVVLLTLTVAASQAGGIELVKLAMVAGAIINIIALAMFGLGATRAARAAVVDLGRWPLVLGGAASLWAAGVTLAQLPWLYKMLYTDGGFGGRDARETAQALAVTSPLVVLVGVAIVGVAISGFAARRGHEELRAHAQAKIAGFVLLMLVSLALQAWMLPKATSMGSFAAMSLFAAAAALVATVMMAKLLGLAAAAVECEPGLPKASIVSDGSRVS